MAIGLKTKNALLSVLVLTGLVGGAYEGMQLWQIERFNTALKHNAALPADQYPLTEKFAAAYRQGTAGEYKHAIQTYGQLLEMTPDNEMQARVHYNVGNNLLRFGLSRRVNDDGSLIEDARYALMQARASYEQALRLDPTLLPARFNLDLLLSIMPAKLQQAEKEQSGVQLSNLPIGLP
jgi:mxaK protein